MKTIGLLGGMSWESTQSYYKLLNEGVKERLGGLHSAPILLYSVDFALIEQMQTKGHWEEAGALLAEAALKLELAGAEMLLLCTNTMHKVASHITQNIKIPFIHIAKSTAKALIHENKKHAILLGTKFTMQETFYSSILNDYGIRITIPSQDAIEKINRIIFHELCLGECNVDSREYFLQLIKNLSNEDKSIDSVILGCTEIGLLLNQPSPFLPYFDTTIIHVKDALTQSLLNI